MPVKHIHIISFDIPYPADYGGIIDIYYKLKALREAGIQIILHCYEYGRQPSKELEDLCLKVHYYPRASGLKYFLQQDPFIVTTRTTNSMPDHLLKDSFPVLFEGLHTTSMLNRCKDAKKKILVRAHNIEHTYYRALSKSEPNLFRKLYLRSESGKLQRYEGIMENADYILGINKHETAYFREKYGEALFLPPFHRFNEVTSLTGSGDYILFHGNLGVPENSEVFLRLAAKTLSRHPYPVVVAGKNPSERFRKTVARYAQMKIIPNPTDQELEHLIQHAQVNLLQTLQPTGMKVKLLHALFAGRHCLVNGDMVAGTGLETCCTIADSSEQIVAKLDELMGLAFTEELKQERRKALRDYSNRAGAEMIIRLLG